MTPTFFHETPAEKADIQRFMDALNQDKEIHEKNKEYRAELLDEQK